MAVVGFSGPMGAGKSTAARLLCQISSRPMKIIKFAQPLYDIQDFVYKRIRSVHSKPDNFTKDRILLQLLGTEWGRDSISPSLWVDLWVSEASQALRQGFNVACDDVRFDNEAKAILSLGGFNIEVHSETARERVKTSKGLHAHPSELGVSTGLLTGSVVNNGTEGQLQLQLAHNPIFSSFYTDGNNK